MNKKRNVFLSAITSLALFASNAAAQGSLDDLSELSFESLGEIVTSVSKKPEPAFQAPAAIYVITQEDIRQSGMTAIPELLRMVPGLQVSRGDSYGWTVTSRGFTDSGFGNKLLVLMDGRSLYTPLFSGMYWDTQDTILDDIDRIEIIRGPGATLWGANAVNGVINIITKSSKETQNTLVSFGAGNEEKGFAETRYGGAINENLHYRIYGKRFNRSAQNTVSGVDADNSWYSNRAGFRVDYDKSPDDNFTIQGDLYDGRIDLELADLPTGILVNDSLRIAGYNTIGRWNHTHEDGAKTMVQAYFDRTERHYSLLKQDINTLDLEYQYAKKINAKNDLIVGAGYRLITDDLRGNNIISYDPTSRSRDLLSAFIQDKYTIKPDKLYLTVGSKFEHNDFTGFEIQPNARITWLPTSNQTVWAAVSRAVRTPNRSEDDINIAVAPGFVNWVGNRDFESEILVAHELGYKVRVTPKLTLDTAAFYNDYDKLRTNEVGSNPPAGSVLALPFDNKAKAESYGFEVSGSWDVLDYWNLKAAYSFLTIDVHKIDGSTSSSVEQDEGKSPRNQFNLRSQLYLPRNIELSNSLYFVEDIKATNISSYVRFDTRVAWEPTPGLELSLAGFNLLDDKHQEAGAPLHGVANEISRSVYGKVTLRF